MIRRQFTVFLAATTAALAVMSGATPAGAGAAPQGADTVRIWNEVTMTALTNAAIAVPEQVLYLTYVHRAVYDGVRRADDRRHRVSLPAAVAAAAHTVLVSHFPTQQVTLDQRYAESLAAIPDNRARRAGIAAGQAAAQKLLRERADDGRNGSIVPVPAPGPGVWRPTPPNSVGLSSWLSMVRPFALRSPAQLRPAGPPALTSARWAADYNETRVLGSAESTTRTAEQTEVARFWTDPPFHQNQRALRTYSQRAGLNAIATARLFALADTAAADALIACWDAKFHYAFWRPFSAIPAGDTDGNPATRSDPGWRPLAPTPNHPEYPSAHSCSTTAIVTVTAMLARSHRFSLDIDSVTTGTTRLFSSVSSLVREVANARVWAGLHWRSSTEAGTRIGRSVAHAVIAQAHDHR